MGGSLSGGCLQYRMQDTVGLGALKAQLYLGWGYYADLTL